MELLATPFHYWSWQLFEAATASVVGFKLKAVFNNEYFSTIRYVFRSTRQGQRSWNFFSIEKLKSSEKLPTKLKPRTNLISNYQIASENGNFKATDHHSKVPALIVIQIRPRWGHTFWLTAK